MTTTAPKGPSAGTEARSSGRSEAQWDELERLARAAKAAVSDKNRRAAIRTRTRFAAAANPAAVL